MNSFVRKLAARLLEQERTGAPEPLTRNRHFEVFHDAQGRLALRIYRHLRSLQRDILGTAEAPVAVDRECGGPDRVRLRISLPGARGVRTAYLSMDELDLLLETPGIRGRLAG